MITPHDTKVAHAVSLRTSVEAELVRRVEMAPDVWFLAGRDTGRLVSEYMLLTDLVTAKRLLSQVNRESAAGFVEGATDFARGTLRDCGVER